MALGASAQTYETQYRRPISDVMKEVASRFGVKFKYDSNVDTTGVLLSYADFRIRPYSLEQTLDNICKHLEWNWWKQNGNQYRIKRYEYPRRHEDEGRQMLDYLAAKYHNSKEWEKRQAVYDFFADVFALDQSMIDESKITIEPEEIMQTKLP